MVSKQHITRRVIFLCVSILMLLLASCSVSTYQMGSYKESQVGTATRDAKALGAVQRVALVAFTAQAPSLPDVQVIGPLVDLAFQQALDEIQKQSIFTFIPMEEVVNNQTYAAMRIELDSQTYTPMEGLTDLREDDSLDITALCDALQVDALLGFAFVFDFDFPTVNAVTLKEKSYKVLFVPPEGKAVWGGLTQTAWEETLIPVPSSLNILLGAPNADQWQVIIEAASEVPKIRAMGGAPIFFLAENAAAAR